MKEFFKMFSGKVAYYLNYIIGAIIILFCIALLVAGCSVYLDTPTQKAANTSMNYFEAVQETFANPQSYRKLRIECTYKGETRLILIQRYFHVVSSLKSGEVAYDKCVIEEIQDSK